MRSPRARRFSRPAASREYGSIVGHGAYLGPDYTADYLRRATDDVAEQYRASGMADTHDAVVKEFRTNRYNADTGTLTFTDHQAAAFCKDHQALCRLLSAKIPLARATPQDDHRPGGNP